jgi:hypothetical protein
MQCFFEEGLAEAAGLHPTVGTGGFALRSSMIMINRKDISHIVSEDPDSNIVYNILIITLYVIIGFLLIV